MKRWIVVFRSAESRTGKVDATVVGVQAANHLAAVRAALGLVHQPWSVAEATLVPKGRRQDAMVREAAAAFA